MSGDLSGCEECLDKEIRQLSRSSSTSATASADHSSLVALRAQIFINRGLYHEAEALISTLTELKHSPGGISAIYQLKLLQEEAAAADSSSPTASPAIKYLQAEAESLVDISLEITDSVRTASLFHIAQELEKRLCHQEAADVLTALLSRCAASIDSSERLVATAKLAIALSYAQPQEAEKSVHALAKVGLLLVLSSSLPFLPPQLDSSSSDPRALELGEIPRLQKRGKGMEKSQELVEAAPTDDTARKEKSAKLQRERIIRRRTKLRELYLTKLQELGKYDPARPIKPDPER
jgi:hypothetical protein